LNLDYTEMIKGLWFLPLVQSCCISTKTNFCSQIYFFIYNQGWDSLYVMYVRVLTGTWFN
jgi:hypothetical protein